MSVYFRDILEKQPVFEGIPVPKSNIICVSENPPRYSSTQGSSVCQNRHGKDRKDKRILQETSGERRPEYAVIFLSLIM